MASHTHDDTGVSKNNNMLFYVAVVVYLLNLWYYGYPAFLTLANGRPSAEAETIVRYVKDAFVTPYLTLLFVLLFAGMYIWGHRKDKSSKYAPPVIVRFWLPLMVKLELHPKFEYTETKNRNGILVLEKQRERVEGQFFVGLGFFLVLLSPVFMLFSSPGTYMYLLFFALYVFFSAFGLAYLILGGDMIHSMNKGASETDANNSLQESFMQEERYINNEYTVNLRTEYKYRGEIRHGWINVINPFRATQVLGTPGSGKSYAVINEFIRQHLAKHFCMYCYDFKFPDLSTIVYNHYRWNKDSFRKTYGVEPKFCVINFENPRKSLRCNPVSAKFLEFVADAYQSAEIFMVNLNKAWAGKQGDFFIESAKNLFTSCLWFLRCYENGKYCTVPHAIELANASYMDTVPILTANPDLYTYMSNFFNSWEGGAQEQLQGQLGSVQNAIAKLASPELYWVMSGEDFTLDLNNPEEPKILCVGNCPEKKDIYSATLGLFNGRIVKIINKKHQHKISLIIDELPTIFFRGLDELIATARSNKVATCLGYQDFSQLRRDYGKEQSDVVMSTIGNTFSGLVTGDTAKALENQFGRTIQHRTSTSTSESGSESTSVSEQMDLVIPASKISTLSQGTFVGTLCDDFGKEMPEKRFFARIMIDGEAVKKEESLYQPLPTFYSFDNADVAQSLCRSVIAFVEDEDNFVAPYLLRKNGLPSTDDFKSMLGNGGRIDVNRTVSMIFTPEFNGKKKTQLAELFLQLGKENSKKITVHEGNLLSFVIKTREMPDLGSFRTHIKDMVADFENEIATWLDDEKEAGAPQSKVSVLYLVRKFRKDIDSLQSQTIEELKEQSLALVRRYVQDIRNVYSRYISLRGTLQGIRDERMKDVVKKNMFKIRSEVKEIVRKSLVDLYYNNYELWDRRLKVLHLKEKEELEKLGVETEK